MRAAKILLQDAKQTFFGPSGRIYEKTGGFDQAKKDFEILKPRNVEEDPVHVVFYIALRKQAHATEIFKVENFHKKEIDELPKRF